MRLTVAIPTYRRPDMLAECLGSLIPQMRNGVELLVVDNDPGASAAAAVHAYERNDIRYVHEPRPGVVQARNRAVAESRGHYLAFIDDDEIADAGWIDALLRHAEMGVAASFGVVLPRYVGAVESGAEALTRKIYTRDLQQPQDADISDKWMHVGTGNSLFDKTACFPLPEPFSGHLNGTGGEDVWFVKSLSERGVGLRWNPQAIVLEQVPAARATMAYLRTRRFRQGQQRIVLMLGPGGPGGWARAGLWMGVGALQWAGHGLRAAGLKAAGRQQWRAAAVQAQGGLGKMLWWKLWEKTPYAGGG